MKFKNLTFILAVLLIAAVALGSVSAAEDIADDALAIDDVAEVDEVSEAPAVAELEETAPAEEEIIDDAIEEPRTITNHQVNANNWTNFDFTQGNVVVDFDNGYYNNFNIKVGNYTTLNGNGATLYGNHDTVIDIANTQGVTINGFNILVNDETKNGISGNYVYDTSIYNNTIQNGDDGINIFRDWNNVSVYNNTIYNMKRDGISFANPTHTDLSTLNGAYIYDNTVYDSTYGIFVGGNFNGEIYDNNLYQVKIGMQFAGKPQAGNGTLIAYVHDNNISAEIGIDMCHPGVKNFTLIGNNINGINMSINTNGSFNKTSDGGIYLYNNTINGDMSADFISSITEAIGNDGTGAYNTPSINSKNLLGSAVEILGDTVENNRFVNGDFSDELEGWEITEYNKPPYDAGILIPSSNASPQIQDDDDEHGNYLNFNANMSSNYVFISQNIDLSDVEYISFDYKYFIGSTYKHYYALKIDSTDLTIESNELTGDGEWHTYTIPKSVFSEYADGVHNVSIKLDLHTSPGLTNGLNCYIDNIIAFYSASEPAKTGDDIQALIDAAADGGIVDLGENLVYVVQDGQTFDLTKKLAFVGNNVTIQASGVSQAGSGALFIANKAGTSFEGINFVNSDGHKEFGQEVSGYGVYLASENITVNNCKFIDWNSGIYGSGAAFCNITNCYFNGSSWAVTGAGKGEKGTKAINLMGCHDLLVKGCTFDGQVLDGISSASNSANLVVIENYFIDNVYAIFFGGASTAGCVIANNTFLRCGYCPNVSAEVNKKIPVISTQKAANGYIITENNIEALDGTTFIMAESGNTAHGYPSLIGDINITANTMTAAEGADPATMTLVHILSNKGPLNPYAPINITGNTLDAGISPLVVWYNDWGNEYGNNPVIPAADKVATSINIKEISTASRKITIELVDVNGDVQAGKEISYSFNGGESLIGETDADGLLTIDVTEDGIVALAFAGDDKLKAAENTVNFASTAAKTATSIIVSEFNTTAVDGKTDGRVGKYFTWTLVDANGNPIANTPMQVGFNGVVYTYEKNGICTDENGVGKLQINLGYKGTYTFAICFLGNDLYNASFAVSKVNVAPQKGSLTVPNKSYSASAKTKTLTATFKSASGKPVADKKITFTVNGKTYTATTNAKGVASVNVSISKKGTYSFTAKYTTNGMYETMTKTAKLTIK